MDKIIDNLLEGINLPLILIVVLITYFVIKLIDELNKEKNVSTWTKRIAFVCVSIVVGIIYGLFTDLSVSVIINSIIISPVAWSWLAKPIANKLGIDYKPKVK